MKIFGINFSKVSTVEQPATKKNTPFVISYNNNYYSGITDGIPTGNYEPPIGFDDVLKKYAGVVVSDCLIKGPHEQLVISGDYMADASATIDDDSLLIG